MFDEAFDFSKIGLIMHFEIHVVQPPHNQSYFGLETSLSSKYQKHEIEPYYVNPDENLMRPTVNTSLFLDRINI